MVGGNHQRSHHPDPCVAGETSAGLAVVAKGDKDSAYGWKSDGADRCAAAWESIGGESRCIHVIARFE
jgi:hypothetical protein